MAKEQVFTFKPCPKPQPQPKKKRQPLSQFSKKGSKRERGLKVVRQQISKDVNCCAGCGVSNCYIECSHTIPRSYHQFFDDPDNLFYLCRDCHRAVESQDYDVPYLITDKLVDYVRKHCPRYYEKYAAVTIDYFLSFCEQEGIVLKKEGDRYVGVIEAWKDFGFWFLVIKEPFFLKIPFQRLRKEKGKIVYEL